jgi:lipoprotein, yaeC family
MKLKKLFIALCAAAAVVGAVAGCGGDTAKSGSADSGKKEITVGINPGYSEKILEVVQKNAEKNGLKVNVQVFSDYVTPDLALASGDIDLNVIQHKPFLDAFNEKNGTNLISIGNTYLAPLRLYSYKVKSVDELQDGTTIAIPNDPTNGARALLLLEKQGLIKLKNGVDPLKAVPQDIGENPKNFNIIELEAPQLPRSLDDTDASIVNAGFASDAGLSQDYAIVVEDDTSPYVNIVAARAEDKDNPLYQQFVKEFQTDEVRQFIIDTCNGALVPGF